MIAPSLAVEVPMSARITLSLAEYREHGLADRYACFENGCIATPLPRSTSKDASNALERACGKCGSPSAVPLDNAVREFWLKVTHGPQVRS